ncbi:hypothetical protein NHX12_011636 [Muraenolepis orangiensis]|uniref:Uncharacterized protein n=1 Tax=Muraenolepis orangiensis TaxID=630683 RepID=A0A9Q0I5W7_9TELE|nr:hypothetical protein NHX12_011636 [Muraenolepis orangiensis]
METSEELRVKESCVPDSTDFEDLLGRLHSLHKDLTRLALQTELRQCDLIVCFNHTRDKMAPLKRADAGQAPPSQAPE